MKQGSQIIILMKDDLKMGNALLRKARKNKGWSQQQLADFAQISLSTVERAERGLSIRVDSIQRISQTLELSPMHLGLLEEPEEVKRRESLKTIGISTSSFLLGTPALLLEGQSHPLLYRWLLDSIESSTKLRWNMYFTNKSSVTGDGLQDQIQVLEQLQIISSAQDERFYEILTQNYQLAGILARDAFQYLAAARFFHKGIAAAQHLPLVDFTMVALSRLGVMYLRQNEYNLALQWYQSAMGISAKACSFTKAYILSGIAEIYARLDREKECYRALDQADAFFQHSHNAIDQDGLLAIKLSLSTLHDKRGECNALLGNPLEGLEMLRLADVTYPNPPDRTKCRLYLQHAEAFLLAKQPDNAVTFALKGLTLGRKIESNENIHWVDEIYQKLVASPWKREPVVQVLRDAIKTNA